MTTQFIAQALNLVDFKNIDLLFVGIAIAAIGILGFIVFFNDRKSVTNRTFLYFSIAAIFWSVSNYLYNQPFSSSATALSLLRLHLFFAVLYCLALFQFFFVFPKKEFNFPKTYKLIIVPIAVLTGLLTLTPFVFSSIIEFSANGLPLKVDNGPGIYIFGAVAFALIFSGILLFIQKLIQAEKSLRPQYIFVLIGLAITFCLHLVFNFFLPAFFNNPNFAPLGAVFTSPFVAFTAYAIIKHKLLNVKVIATEILAFLLSVVSLFEVLLSGNPVEILFRASVFLAVFGFSILLIQSVRREVEQREQLQILYGKLEALDKLKSEFLSFASHQVKSPMAVVKGYAQLIADGSYGEASDKVKEVAHKIKESADRLVALVNNLLDMRKIEEGKMDFAFTQVDIIGLLRSMTEEYKIIGVNKGLAVSFESSIESLKIKADEQKIRQVIQNIIDNSIKYTDRGFVKVSFTDEGEKVLITVSDSGRGISADLQKKLFQQFMRDEKTKNEIQGTGLGLFIAKEIVKAHNGEIWAESDGEGKGSRFYVRLSKQ